MGVDCRTNLPKLVESTIDQVTRLNLATHLILILRLEEFIPTELVLHSFLNMHTLVNIEELRHSRFKQRDSSLLIKLNRSLNYNHLFINLSIKP